MKAQLYHSVNLFLQTSKYLHDGVNQDVKRDVLMGGDFF